MQVAVKCMSMIIFEMPKNHFILHHNANFNGTTVKIGSNAAQNTWTPPPTVNIGSASAIFFKKIFMTFWSVGPFCYMVYGIWYVVYGMKMAFTVYSHMFRVCHAWVVYNIVHLFLVYHSPAITTISL